MVQYLAPVGTLEESLAGQIVLNLWRLQRAGVYEAGVANGGIESVAAEAERQAEIAAARRYDDRSLPSAGDAGRLGAISRVEKWRGGLGQAQQVPALT